MDRDNPLRPHELAEQIKNSGYEVKGGRVESARLYHMIDRSESVWRELKKGRFEQNEFGYVTIELEDWVGDYLTPSGDNVDALVLYFHDPDQVKVPLGRIARLSDGRRATVTVVGGEKEDHVPLLPDDPRWDAVVGVADRAIAHCLAQKSVPPGEAGQ